MDDPPHKYKYLNPLTSLLFWDELVVSTTADISSSINTLSDLEMLITITNEIKNCIQSQPKHVNSLNFNYKLLLTNPVYRLNNPQYKNNE